MDSTTAGITNGRKEITVSARVEVEGAMTGIASSGN